MTTEHSNQPAGNTFTIVAIGASAEGVEAVSSFFEALPSDTGMAYVYIQHLDPHFKSKLTEVAAAKTKMPVREAEHLMPIAPNCVYVIPPNTEMALRDGLLTLAPRNESRKPHMPIDQFMLSLAEKKQYGAIGIVFSGADSDGTLGLKAIKMAGGFTFVQDETASFQSMPRSAIAEGVVDKVLSPRQMAEELERLSKNAETINDVVTGAADPAIPDGDEHLQAILQLLKKNTGVDFTHYKMNTIKRRIVRRMLLHKLETVKEYLFSKAERQ